MATLVFAVPNLPCPADCGRARFADIDLRAPAVVDAADCGRRAPVTVDGLPLTKTPWLLLPFLDGGGAEAEALLSLVSSSLSTKLTCRPVELSIRFEAIEVCGLRDCIPADVVSNSRSYWNRI